MKVGGMDIVLPVRDDFAFVPASLKLPNGEARFYLSFPRRLGNTDNGAKHLVFREIKGGGYEQHTRNLLERAIKAGDLFIDVGAHWGFLPSRRQPTLRETSPLLPSSQIPPMPASY